MTKKPEWKPFENLDTSQLTNMTSQLKFSLITIKDELIKKREGLKKIKNGK